MEINKRNIRAWSMMGQTGQFGVIMSELAGSNEDFCVVTADLCQFSGLERFSQEYPERFYNVGIAEQNMIGVSAGIAREGIGVFAASYATFITSRALDQVRISMSYMKLPVKLVGLTAGFNSGILGATHMAIEDVAIMRALPDITIISPADCTEAAKCMEAVIKYDKPVYIRLTGGDRAPIVYTEDYNYRIGKAISLRNGNDVCILASGSMVYESLQAAEQLEKSGISTGVIDVHTIKPLDLTIAKEIVKYKLIVTAEEHSVIGGLGDAIADLTMRERIQASIMKLGVEGSYPHAASYTTLLQRSGLTSDEIVKKVVSRIGKL